MTRKRLHASQRYTLVNAVGTGIPGVVAPEYTSGSLTVKGNLDYAEMVTTFSYRNNHSEGSHSLMKKFYATDPSTLHSYASLAPLTHISF